MDYNNNISQYRSIEFADLKLNAYYNIILIVDNKLYLITRYVYIIILSLDVLVGNRFE